MRCLFASPKLSRSPTSNLIKHKIEKECPEFLEAEEMGIQCPRRCSRFSSCKECSMLAQHITRKEQAENNMRVDMKRIVMKYPNIKIPL